MDERPMRTPIGIDATYEYLLTLWTSGVRDYQSMLSDYLMANSIIIMAIGLIVSREFHAPPLTVLIVLLCIFGILLCLQMAIVLGRLSGQNALWEWRLRGVEQSPEWHKEKLMMGLHSLHAGRILEQGGGVLCTRRPTRPCKRHVLCPKFSQKQSSSI